MKEPAPAPKAGREPDVIARDLAIAQAALMDLHLAGDPAKADQAHQIQQDIFKLEQEYRVAMRYGPDVQLYTHLGTIGP
jgi:hypothetical protein